MYVIDNKFKIGEECYTVYKKPIDYECPICKGDGKFLYNGYETFCKNCNGTGKLHNNKQTVLETCKVKIRRLVVSIWNNKITYKYKIDCIDNYSINVRNRNEATLFKTLKEAEEYCKAVNTKQIAAEF